ncbi:MAG: tRNA uridine-5-carboxymethylaminomethyl(34) synthesis enzyme MnmG [Magnetococcales bacterium]|nr:tRNA uridine-5-carboxymethylaminomethyl(34) synthesis enzyme MnmG [Magnetococcales bacterium]
MSIHKFSVVVVGAGHAGVEAAHAAAKMGVKTLLLTQNLETIGQMSCNPAIGGLGKGHLVCEIDALGGIMGRLADQTGIQFRLLNRRKGPAVRGPRAQIDKADYRKTTRDTLDKTANLTLRQGEATDLLIENGKIIGIMTDWGIAIEAQTVVITTGTFLRGLAHIGDRSFPSGRLGDAPSTPLSSSLSGFGLNMFRLKTGTPPRLDGNTINWAKTIVQEGDIDPLPFSFLTKKLPTDQLPCHITHTNGQTHKFINDNLHRAPLFTGQIKGIGPRYCPSIEDKIVRFAERDSHQIFLEPEGRNTSEIYPNGISTSLPIDVQLDVVHSINGLENVQIIRPGYAIEYDMVDPTQLDFRLGVKGMNGLFLAGQINGTTGYEEAAAQGLVAGINAALLTLDREPLYFDRGQSYIGVMIDDLITKGVDEPYRMFTSRAEFRILLRTDNADSRLTPIGREIGLVCDERWKIFQNKISSIAEAKKVLGAIRLNPNCIKNGVGGEKRSALELLSRNDLDRALILKEAGLDNLEPEVAMAIEVEAHYQGYIEKQEEEVGRFRKAEKIIIPDEFSWDDVPGLSIEICQKLAKVSPKTLGQAYRVPGVTPTAISVLMVFLNAQRKLRGENAEQ